MCHLSFPIGPNSATGHTSTIMAVENSINFALRLIKPVLQGKAMAVDVNPDAEKQYIDQIQTDLQQTVWLSGGCSNWYNRAQDGSTHNGMLYPYSQPYFWYRCLFPVYKDFKYDVSLHPLPFPLSPFVCSIWPALPSRDPYVEPRDDLLTCYGSLQRARSHPAERFGEK